MLHKRGKGGCRKSFIKRWVFGNMSLLQELTENEVQKDVKLRVLKRNSG